MQEYTDDRKYDCIVVGGGASGLAAISAMADLGVTKTILLEKNNEVGGQLLTNAEPIVLSGKMPILQSRCRTPRKSRKSSTTATISFSRFRTMLLQLCMLIQTVFPIQG